jgi:hypothetical protein
MTDNNDLEITLKITVAEANKILEALQELRFKDVANLFNKIHGQAGPQIQLATAQQTIESEVIPAGTENNNSD